MNIAILSIGNEILNGSIVDTNSNYIAKNLEILGYSADSIIAVSDDVFRIEKVFRYLSRRFDLVITTGGLGPTFDDNTTLALSKAASVDLKLSRKAYIDVLGKVKRKGVKLKLSHLRQAYLPEGCDIVENRYGTACGVMIKINRAYFISMPGVPSEMKPMFDQYVIPVIKRLFPVKARLRYDLKLVGVPESDMDEFLKGVDTDHIDIILNAQEGELAVRLFSYEQEYLDRLYNLIFDKFGNKLYSKKDESIEDAIDNLLNRNGLKLAVVESFTGGYLTQLISNKDSFYASFVSKTDDIDNIGRFKESDITIYPSNLNGSEFVANIFYNNALHQEKLRYMGNKNFMRKSVSKRTLGHLYKFLKSLDF